MYCMSKKFYCPHCGGNLNPNQKIIHVTQKENGEKGLVLQSETFGEYKYITGIDFTIDKGEKLLHFCPLCQKELTCSQHPNCSELIVTQGSRKGKVIFTNHEGIQSTFVDWEDGEKFTYGKDRASVFPGYPVHVGNYEDHKVACRG